MKGRNLRSSWIDPRYQLMQALIGIGANLMVALLMAALMSWFYLLIFRAPLGIDHNRLLPLLVAGMIMLISIVSAYLSFRRSRSVAGMMRKIAVVMSAAAEGRFPDRPLVFRKGDYTAGLAGPLNRCLVVLRRSRKEREDVALLLLEITRALQSGSVMEETVTGRLEEIIDKMQRDVGHEHEK